MKVTLLLLIAGVASFYWNQQPSIRISVTAISATLLLSVMILSAIMETRKFDQVWFNSRAVAESVKSESWMFMMRAKSYDGTIPNSQAQDRLLKNIKEILSRQQSVASELPSQSQEGTMITEHMKLVRNSSLKDRRDYYIQNRIHEQRNWYATRAKASRDQELHWAILSWILEGGSLAMLIFVVGFGELIINSVGVLTTAAAGVLTWMNARDFLRLSQSYGFARQELALLEDSAKEVTTEEKLEDVVSDSERTISREHSMWLARRR